MGTQLLERPTVDLNWDYFRRQSQALDILDMPSCDELLFGGAKGGGKSVLGCRWCMREASKIIKEFGLKPTAEPICMGFMGRKRGKHFKDTTLETWRDQVDSRLYQIHEQKGEIIILDTIKYHIGGFDNEKVISKFNSGEYCRVFVDQAEEITQDEIAVLRGAMRKTIRGIPPGYKMLLTANPAQNWLKREFIKNPEANADGMYFLQSLPADNPNLPAGYIEKLKKAYRHRPELLEAYLYGSWDSLEAADIIIKDLWVQEGHKRHFTGIPSSRLIACDVARFGDDRTVIYYMEDTHIRDPLVYGQRDTHYTSGRIAAMVEKHKHGDERPLVVIDGDGPGGPVADNLRAWGIKVHEIHSASTENVPEKFYNLRAQMWWEAGEMFADGEVSNEYTDEALDLELTIPTYKYKNGRLLVESKDDIKKPERYGKSPDLADAYIYGLYGLRLVRPQIKRKKETRAGRRRSRRKRRSAMAA